MVVYILANIYSYVINKTKESTLTRREKERYSIYNGDSRRYIYYNKKGK